MYYDEDSEKIRLVFAYKCPDGAFVYMICC